MKVLAVTLGLDRDLVKSSIKNVDSICPVLIHHQPIQDPRGLLEEKATASQGMVLQLIVIYTLYI
jgi:hypothetical protein